MATLKQIYKGGTTSAGQLFFPGLMPSSEAGENGWQDWVTGSANGKAAAHDYAAGFFRDMVYDDPAWHYRTASVDESLRAADEKLAGTLNSTDPHLEKFKARGGKLILYHGWLDPAISPLNSVKYYLSVSSAMGQAATDEFVRLYMVPGMRHCVGGPGPFIFGQLGVARSRDSAHNIFTALEEWAERGTAPNSIIATKLKDDKDPAKGVLLTRPLCPFPQQMKFAGNGSPSEAGSFSCQIHNGSAD
jgi:feruloyl esterase